MDSFYVSKCGAYLRYHDLPGSDPAIVFLHGLGSASSSCFPLIARHGLLVDRRALLIDFLGFGFSDRPHTFGYTIEEHADTIALLLDHLRMRRSVIVGHSMGGSIAIVLAAHRPELAAALILAEANLDPGPGVVSGPIAAQTETAFVKTGKEAFLRGVISEGWMDYAGTVRAADAIAMNRSAVSLIARRSPTFREQLIGISAPRTFIFGEKSLPDPDVEWLTAHGVKVAVVAGAGHDMMTDNPMGLGDILGDAILAQSGR